MPDTNLKIRERENIGESSASIDGDEKEKEMKIAMLL